MANRAGLEEIACECYQTTRRTFERLLPAHLFAPVAKQGCSGCFVPPTAKPLKRPILRQGWCRCVGFPTDAFGLSRLMIAQTENIDGRQP